MNKITMHENFITVSIFNNNSDKYEHFGTIRRKTEKAFSIVIDRGNWTIKNEIIWIPFSICEIEKTIKQYSVGEYCNHWKIKIPMWFTKKNGFF